MEKKFWDTRWEKNEIRFHSEDFHPFLVESLKIISLEKNSEKNPLPQVFVPLCGKSLDLLYLKNCGFKTLGIEFVEKAIIDFQNEQKSQGIKFKEPQCFQFPNYGVVTEFKGESLLDPDIYQMDFYHLDLLFPRMKGIRLIYDRAALVSQPPDLWEKYSEIYHKLAQYIKKETGKDLQILLKTFCHPEEEKRGDGPPFTIVSENVNQLFRAHWTIQDLKNNGEDFLLTWKTK